VLGIELRDISLVEIDLRLKRRLFEQIEKVAFFDFGALDELSLVEKRANPRHQGYSSDRLDAADEFVRLRDLLLLHTHDANRRRPSRRRLRPG
jgi:hypothetical protein